MQLLVIFLAGFSLTGAFAASARTITVAQSGTADVVGNDNAALQKAAKLLKLGDTLLIGPGTYDMQNSLFVPSGVTVRGTPGKTILMKGPGVESALIDDGDYGESILRVAESEKFRPGMGIAVVDDQLKDGWDISVSTIIGVNGPTLSINPRTVRDYDVEKRHAKVRNTFPILCAIDTEKVTFEDIIVDGNRGANAYIDGCRGGAIYMYNVKDIIVRNCTARNYNGDGISFQITENVQILNSESYGHAGYGVHPGTGSERPLVKGCRMHDNGQIGLFLCWRVKHGTFENNVIQDNGHYGISIGHKDTDNLFINNTVKRNGSSGVYFRHETMANSGHRNKFRNNQVLDNGNAKSGYGFYISPYAGDLVIENNRIAETRKSGGTQRIGIYKAAGAGSLQSRNSSMSGHTEADYRDGAVGTGTGSH
jgi:parallel beta-helix repeat protein